MRYAGYLEHGYTSRSGLTHTPTCWHGASWANWDCNGNLWVARPGVVEQYTLSDLSHGTPSFAIDVDQFEPPFKES